MHLINVGCMDIYRSSVVLFCTNDFLIIEPATTLPSLKVDASTFAIMLTLFCPTTDKSLACTCVHFSASWLETNKWWFGCRLSNDYFQLFEKNERCWRDYTKDQTRSKNTLECWFCLFLGSCTNWAGAMRSKKFKSNFYPQCVLRNSYQIGAPTSTWHSPFFNKKMVRVRE